MSGIKENTFELEVMDRLKTQGWEPAKPFNTENPREVINYDILHQSLKFINNETVENVEKAIWEIKKNLGSLDETNKKAMDFLINGVKVYDESSKRTKTMKIVSEDFNMNTYHAVRQLEICDNNGQRIPDIVLFLNGLPVVVMELKSPTAHETIEDAFNQNESLKRRFPKLFTFNVMNFVSNRIVSLYGSTLSNFKKMSKIKNLKTNDNDDLFEFLFSKSNFHNIMKYFTFYAKDKSGFTKYMAAPHQIYAVYKTIDNLKTSKNNKGGVVWHTQGSGKSVTMVILAKLIIDVFSKSTLIYVTDRKDLDEQLFQRFSAASEYVRNVPNKILNRNDLIEKLKDKKHFGLFFTTVQKFYESTGALTDRKDVFIIVDEAHRTQNNFETDFIINHKDGEIKENSGFAKFMRDAFPNATFVGFTGTPLMGLELSTVDVFGEYNHIYKMNEAEQDGAIVPIKYELRNVEIKTNDGYLHEMDEIQKVFIDSMSNSDANKQNKLDTVMKKSINVRQILENEDVIRVKVKDIAQHWRKRRNVLHGKSMVVAISKKAALLYYKILRQELPEISDQIILVLSIDNKDNQEMIDSTVHKNDLESVANEFRKDNSKFKIVVVVDMWLTGFDVPDLDTMYLDKIIKWHNLMQAIARVNRTYENKNEGLIKESGLVVDYIGVWKFLSDALLRYNNKIDCPEPVIMQGVEELYDEIIGLISELNEKLSCDFFEYDSMNEKGKYNFIMDIYEMILTLNADEQNEVTSLMNAIKRLAKPCATIIDSKIKDIVKILTVLNSLLKRNFVDADNSIMDIIEEIKCCVNNSIDININRDYNDGILVYKNISDITSSIDANFKDDKIGPRPQITAEAWKNKIKGMIKKLEKNRPVTARRLSEILQSIVLNLQNNKTEIEETIKKLINLSEEVIKHSDESFEVGDRKLSAFIDILSNDKYLHDKKTNDEITDIAIDLVDIIRSKGLKGNASNPKVRSNILREIKILLRNKHGYPPAEGQVIADNLFAEVTYQLKHDVDEYF